VLPAFAGLALAAIAPLLLLAWLYREFGAEGALLGGALLAAAGTAGLCLCLRRPVLRRRGGHYTPAELAGLDDQGLTLATARMLRRDGWQVFDLSLRGRPRLYAFDHNGRELDIALRAVSRTVEEDEDGGGFAPLREVGRPSVDNLLRVVIHLGQFSREDVLWASRHGGVHLLDGTQLQQWAAGATLDDLGLPGLNG
jgi:hypothetical protein